MIEPPSAAPTKRDISLAALPAQRVSGLLTAVVVPRPIAWVSSRAADGTPNLAPHSYFTVLGHHPPTLGFTSVGAKDTLRNVRATGDYVINIAGEDLAQHLNLTAADFPPDQSEFAWAGLTPAPSAVVAAPGVAEAPVSLEMRLVGVTPFGDPPCFLVAGEVVHVRIAEAVLGGDRVRPDLLRALGRLAGPTYCRSTDLFEMPRPTYAGLLAAGSRPARPED